MLRKFIVEVKHYATHDSLESKDVKRDHIVYMPESEYDTSGARYKNRRWVEDKLEEKSSHQKIIISEIKNKLTELFLEVYTKDKYDYIDEKRTFTASNIVEEISKLVTNDIHIGESDRARLKIAMLEEKRLRKSNEGRSKNKNNIDKNYQNLVK